MNNFLFLLSYALSLFILFFFTFLLLLRAALYPLVEVDFLSLVEYYVVFHGIENGIFIVHVLDFA